MMSEAVWGFVGAVVGACVSILTTHLANRNAARLHEDANSKARQDERRAFQRQTLIELQDAFHDAVRAVSKIHIHDLEAARINGTWTHTLVPEDLNVEHREANRKVMLLVERVADDRLRQRVIEQMESAQRVVFSASGQESTSRMNALTDSSVDLLREIGAELRTLY